MGGLTLLAQTVSQTDNTSIFAPVSPPAESIRQLAVLVFVISVFIFFIVEGVLFYTLWRFRRSTATANESEPPQVYGSKPIEVAWTAAPALVVFVLVLVTTRTLWEVKPTPPEPQVGDNTLFVTVIGHQWWWEYVYETYDGKPLGFITANELHVPASTDGTVRNVYLRLKSADVVHSFWIPRLHGKVDLIPGRTNDMWFETASQGLLLGQCAEYCGTQHAGMLLRVVVDTPEAFEAWLQNEAQAARNASAQGVAGNGADPDRVRQGRELFLSHSCINCHRVRGTVAAGTYAPDLTHLMSRETLAAGMEPNNRENLVKWIRNPHDIKPGNLMPAFGLSDAEVQLMVDYLSTLK